MLQLNVVRNAIRFDERVPEHGACHGRNARKPRRKRRYARGAAFSREVVVNS